MTLDEFVGRGWSEHATDAPAVMERLHSGVALAATGADLAKLAALITHVAGEHLGRWDDGLALLDGLVAHAAFDAATAEGKAVLRSMAVLHGAAGRAEAMEALLARALTGGALPPASDRIRVLAVMSAALLGQKRTAEAAGALRAALDLAAYGPSAADPAARALAVTCNNMACELEERSARSPEDTQLMLLAAESALKYWSLAGGWLETERAHYRLAMSCIQAGQASRALEHAQRCREIIRDNRGEPGEAFFAWEAIAGARHAGGDTAGARAAANEAAAVMARIEDASFREYAEAELGKLLARLGG